jgi:hypothetical protein
LDNLTSRWLTSRNISGGNCATIDLVSWDVLLIGGFTPLAGKRVTVSGKLFTRGGSRALAIEKIDEVPTGK